VPAADPPAGRADDGLRSGRVDRFDADPPGDPAPEGDAHPVNLDEERSSERAARADGDLVARMDPHLAEPCPEGGGGIDPDDAGTLSVRQLV